MKHSNQLPSNRIAYVLIILFSVSGFIATDIYLPSLPALTKAFDTSTGLVQFSLSSFLLGFAISQFAGGISSDRFGRRPIILLGYMIFIVGSLLTLTAKTINMLLIARFVQGLGIGAVTALARVLVRDLFHGPKMISVLSFLAMAITLAPALAPALGGYIQDTIGFRGNFIVMLLYGIGLTVLAYYLLPETNQHLDHRATKLNVISTNIQLLFKSPQFVINVACNAVAFAVIISYSTVYPFIFQNMLSYSAKLFGVFTLLISSGLVLGLLTNGHLVKYFHGESTIRFGQYLIIFASAGLMILGIIPYYSVPLIIVLTLIAVVGVAFILPTTAGLILAPFPKMAGTVGAVYGAGKVLVSALIGAALSILHITNLTGVASCIFILGLSGLLIRKRWDHLL